MREIERSKRCLLSMWSCPHNVLLPRHSFSQSSLRSSLEAKAPVPDFKGMSRRPLEKEAPSCIQRQMNPNEAFLSPQTLTYNTWFWRGEVFLKAEEVSSTQTGLGTRPRSQRCKSQLLSLTFHFRQLLLRERLCPREPGVAEARPTNQGKAASPARELSR